MSHKKVVAPVGAAIAALIANVPYANQLQPEAPHDSSKPGERTKATATSIDPVLQRLMYQIGEKTHTLTLHKSLPGTLYAQHGSHTSHRSHNDHISHRSGS